MFLSDIDVCFSRSLKSINIALGENFKKKERIMSLSNLTLVWPKVSTC